MSSQTSNGHELWLELRRQENFYRFAGDVLLALMKEMEKNSSTARSAEREDLPGFTINPWPVPPCIPGKPCMKTIEQLRDYLDRMAQHSVAIGDALDEVFEKAEEMGIEKLTFQATQLPTYPEGAKLSAEGPVEAGPKK
jgi:histidinol phosphatase-like enzyme